MNQAGTQEFAGLLEAVREESLDSSLVTIQRMDPEAIGETGIPSKECDGAWKDVEGLCELPAVVSSDIYMTNTTRSVERTLDSTIATENSWHVLLMGFFPQISQGDRAVIRRANVETALDFDIAGVEHDSQSVMTRIEVKRYR